ncbi:MAG: hypothetical protein ACE37F_24955 [Nannocystaceae bacterium]
MTDAPPKPRRRLALDFLRGLAVFLMIEQHVGIWVWANSSAEKLASQRISRLKALSILYNEHNATVQIITQQPLRR